MLVQNLNPLSVKRAFSRNSIALKDDVILKTMYIG
jgi:hypothetical protein